MSIVKVNPSDIESFTVVTNPVRTYTSSSIGVSGIVNVFSRRSDIEKDFTPRSFSDDPVTDADVNELIVQIATICREAYNTSIDPNSTPAQVANAKVRYTALIDSFFESLKMKETSIKKQKILDIIRFVPSTGSLGQDTLRKLIVKDILNPHYRVSYPSAHWAYTNYNTINFFTASTVPAGSALLYPNIAGPAVTKHDGYVTGTYSLSGAFSFDFYLNPRYQPDVIDGSFNAGTIFHLSSSYALSLITGSAKDYNGKSTGYRLQLQLSHSADIPPSIAQPGSYPSDLVFRSDDNSLTWNKWHHVVVRWGTNLVNEGTGSFNIDGVDRGVFVIPSGTVAPLLFDASIQASPDVLCIGNYWEGVNFGTSKISNFFSADASLREGLKNLNTATGISEPTSYTFRHPLNAEIHDLSIKRYYMTNADIEVSSSVGPAALNEKIAFYMPPFFTTMSPLRRSVGASGGVPLTPALEMDGKTYEPFNIAMAFGVNGHYINIENYTRDFANNQYPRAHLMSASIMTTSDVKDTANRLLYSMPGAVRRNLLIMPCDDGNFIPNYDLLVTESKQTNRYRGDDSFEDFSMINLSDMLASGSLFLGNAVNPDDRSSAETIEDQIGFSPEKPRAGIPNPSTFFTYKEKATNAAAIGRYNLDLHQSIPLAIHERTRDSSSNQVTFFDVSNLYYGKRIMPGTLIMNDTSLSGSSGAIRITLKDDGLGNVYRADAATKHATWNSCGNVFYDEGIIVIKNPHLYFYGKDGIEISFRGEQNVHSMKVEVIAPQNMLNSSSNPSFVTLSASGYAADPDPNYVYITGLNFHDENLNVVMKSQLAQPIVKRHGDRILFKVGMDF